MGEVSPVGARLQCAWNAKVRHGYGMGWVLPRMFLYCINEPVQGGRAGGGFSGALRPCLTKSKEAILLQSRDWGEGRAGLYFFKWRIERGCGMNDKGLRGLYHCRKPLLPASLNLSPIPRGLSASPRISHRLTILHKHKDAFPNTNTHRPPRPSPSLAPPHKHLPGSRCLALPHQHTELESKGSIQLHLKDGRERLCSSCAAAT
ncbi:uncharacterized protein K444DRAFT_47724 [Hyaloscypha bicolor E]|uniref:Uncharacterized protein n=1 Tax=Hyaloscypha bicolor E TaxID=1095630 RepID=A0A2J6T280_9HELO|nr:uncharacterized protein K444DRAFT_47724 [Hyaloscypha bicolor E]PMD57134.1 hypothetical protein K444DRAFT_47724 [Hyaloscypha bicolor E]